MTPGLIALTRMFLPFKSDALVAADEDAGVILNDAAHWRPQHHRGGELARQRFRQGLARGTGALSAAAGCAVATTARCDPVRKCVCQGLRSLLFLFGSALGNHFAPMPCGRVCKTPARAVGP
jgi:hypothetical protein